MVRAMSTPTRPRPLRRGTRVLLDIGGPLLLFYALRGLGVGDTVALAAGAVPPLLAALWTAARHRRPDGFALAVLAVMAAGLLASLISGSPREILVRGALLSFPVGVWTLVSLRARRPLTFLATRTLLPRKADLMDRMWDTDARFRRAFRAITAMWGSVSIADSGLRVLMAYTLPVAVVPAYETGLAIATVVVLQLPTHLLLRRAGVWHRLFAPHHIDADPPEKESHVHAR